MGVRVSTNAGGGRIRHYELGGPDDPETEKTVSKTVMLPIESVSLFKRRAGMDTIYLNISEELQHKIFGKNYEYLKGGGFRMDVSKGMGEAAIKALGMEGIHTQTMCEEPIPGPHFSKKR